MTLEWFATQPQACPGYPVQPYVPTHAIRLDVSWATGTAPSVKGNALVRAIETGVHSFESAGPEAFDAEGDATEKATQATAAAVPEVWTTYEAEISAAAWDRRHIRDIFLACTVPEDEPRGTGDDVSKSGPDCESPFDFSPDPSSDVLQSWAPFEGFIGALCSV